MTWFNPNLSEHTPDPFEEAKDVTPPPVKNVRTDKWINYPTENPIVVHGGHNAQQSVYLTAFGVGLLAFLAGFGICWLVFVR